MNLKDAKRKIDDLHSKGITREDVVTIVSGFDMNGGEVEALLYIDLAYAKAEAITSVDWSEVEYNVTDAGNAEYFCNLYGDQLRYDHRLNRWLEYKDHHWKPENDGEVMRLALKSTRDRYKSAVNIRDLKLRERVSKWAIQSEQRIRLEACIAIAKSLKPIADDGEGWDADPWLLCVKNGVIDLRTGERRVGKPEDRITMQANVTHDQDADCPRWKRFIRQISGDDQALVDYIRVMVGYSLTGDTKQQCWFFLWGLGSNGKTTLTMTIRRLMGDYGMRLDADDLMVTDRKTRGSSPKEGIANLRYKRYVVASEVQDGKKLDVGLVKDMSGQDSIKARRLYEHEEEFQPTHKLWMFGNHKPIISDSTNAAWRRIKFIEMSYTVPPEQVDLDLQCKLENEMSGILNWGIVGCLRLQHEGMPEPACVTNAVATYRHESDILGDFIDDCCVIDPLGTFGKTDMKSTYDTWCQTNGQTPVGQRTFKTRLIERGVGEGRVGKMRYWMGIRPQTDDDDNSDNNDNLSPDFETGVTTGDDIPQSPLHERRNKTLCEKQARVVTSVTNPSPEGKDNDNNRINF